MNDRFRFRIFEKYNKEMVYDNNWFIGNDNHQNLSEAIEEITKDDDKILMQSTGLRDKAGTLIYEGDRTKDGCGNIDEIVFHECGAFYIRRNKTYNTFIDGSRIEVIGNIYQENPELLEVDDDVL